ncbi:DUF2267 domain-containing protein [Hyphomicrobium sp.]|jgi:uncharacterized protein (DUF2267 family)|uniref:DUF2267 domain-containing protein n=1 Tax=Hyphomicrobium sp. TaxID=82 RepID=UPI002BBA0B75|nr:DUF2267 domain-containing protein [Hyphomicrobium sp.]HVZ04025.1 DUF2267 domain-containing protein [Hyphomicrobium sp.]
MTFPPSVARTVQKTQEWLKELSDNGDLADPQEAYGVLRAVLHHLRDRLTLEEAVDLGAQLPTLIRGIYYEGWQPRRPAHRIRSRQKFVHEVAEKDFPNAVPSERAIRDVFALLAHHCDPGEISDVIGQLPAELKELWPKTAQTFRERTA